MTASPRETTLLLILDACRADYIHPDRTPFLARLRDESLTGGFLSPPGFAQRTSMFTGTFPDTSGNMSAFAYGPHNSPFAWTRKLGPLMHLYRPRAVMIPARAAIRRVSKWITGQYHTDPAWIRGPFLPYFEVVEDSRPIFDPGALPHESVFDLLRSRGLDFFYGAHPVSGDDDEIFQMLLERIHRQDPTSLYVAQFSALDEGGHRHGPWVDGTPASTGIAPAPDQTAADRAFMLAQLREVDRKCEALVRALDENYAQRHVLILGDHGMAPVRQRVDVLASLKQLPLTAGKDYVVFLDSTFAKVWFHNDRARELITDRLSGADHGWVLDEAQRRRLRIHFDHRRYGDLIFTAKPGVLFWPDYFHVVERPIKGMHGYVDKREETMGALLLNGPRVQPGQTGRRILVDVMPTLCDLVGVKAPKTNEGTSLLSSRKATAEPYELDA